MAHQPYHRNWPDPFVGGALCLDFINTVEYLTPSSARDRLTDYFMVLRWSAARESLPDRAIERLARRARRDRRGASLAWRNCIALREALRVLVGKLQAGESPGRVVAGLNGRISGLPPLATLTAAVRHSRFVFDAPGRDLNELTWPIVWSAAAVLVSEYVERLGYCHASPCRYVFIDLSRNQTRLWCADSCGNRARVRRHQKRVDRQGHGGRSRRRSSSSQERG